LIPNATIPSHQPISTLDADVAFDTNTRLVGSIGNALKSAGFHEELSAKHEPPASSYALGDGSSFYAEFLTPLVGGRPPEKRAQDVLYVHDTIELFGASLGRLNEHWESSVRATIRRNAVAEIHRVIDAQYGKVTNAIRGAALIPQDRSLIPERLQMRCALGLKRIFGEP
jgi:hypothetical protein